MADNYYVHPRRFPLNAPGAFYTTGRCYQETARSEGGVAWHGDCLQCEAPELEAPELLAPLSDENLDTYFVRQPETPTEIELACRALQSCCVGALRYGGKDGSIIKRLGNSPEYCDYVQTEDGSLELIVRDDKDLAVSTHGISNSDPHEPPGITFSDDVRFLFPVVPPRSKWWQFWR